MTNNFAILRTEKLKTFGNIGGSLAHNFRDIETPNLFNIADGHVGGMRVRRVGLAPILVTHAFNPVILFAVRNLAHFLPSKATAN